MRSLKPWEHACFLPAVLSFSVHGGLLAYLSTWGQDAHRALRPAAVQTHIIRASLIQPQAAAAPRPQASKAVIAPAKLASVQLAPAQRPAPRSAPLLALPAASQRPNNTAHVSAPTIATQPAPVQVPASLASGIVTSPANSNLATGSAPNLAKNASAITSAAPTQQPPSLAKPDYAYSPEPDYPELLREQGIGGAVWLKVWVHSNGQPGQIALLRGSGYRLLDDAALKAVQNWRFLPAKQGAIALASWVEFPIRFRPQQDEG